MWTEEYKKQYHKDYHKVWYEKNKERRQKEIREYGLIHRADSVRRTQKYVSKNREKVVSYNKGFNQTPSGRYRFYMGAAKKRGKEFLLSPEDFSEIIVLPCVYCGDGRKVGVDRIDNSLGYTKENSAPCCKTCNYMKKNHSVEDFLSHIKKIHDHQKS